MKHFRKICIIIGLVFLLAGSIVAMTGVALAGFDFRNLSTTPPYQQVTARYDASEVTSLEIEDYSRDVTISTWDQDTIEITYYENEEVTYDIKQDSNGKLSVAYISKQEWYQMIGLNFSLQDCTLTICIPREMAGSIDVSTSSGNILATDISAKDSFSAESSSGNIALSNINADNLSASSTSGEIQIDGANITQECTANATSGDLSLQNISASICGFSATSGNIQLADVSTQENVITTTSGDIFFEGVQADHIVLEATSGNIVGTLNGNQEDYTIYSNTSSGDVHLPPSYNGEKELIVSTTSGDIGIQFER